MAHGRSAKRRRLTPPKDDNVVSETVKSGDLFSRAAKWDLEQHYEQKTRTKKHEPNTRLPIKTAEGHVEHVFPPPMSDESDDLDSKGEGAGGLETPPTEEANDNQNIPLKEQIISAKEELSRIATLLSEDPEEHAGSFKKLGLLAGPKSHPSVQKLALATQAAVYKDIIPGYRIRAYSDEEVGIKISKEVRRIRQYEQAMVAGYGSYMKRLTSIAKSEARNVDSVSLKSVAIGCACALVIAVPHFNFRTELLNILIHQVTSRQTTPNFTKCIETLETLFQWDDDGAPSQEAVSLLTKMMKAKDYLIRAEVLNTFFHLRLLSELSPHSPTSKKGEKKFQKGKKPEQGWEHRSKKQRKLAREQRAVEKDMREADALVNCEERDKMQSETLKMVFATYFRILKLQVPHLMGAVLEGLAKYAHLINQDLFGDLLEALKDIVRQAASEETDDETEMQAISALSEKSKPRDATRESLLAIQTAFTLLSGQDASKSASELHLDLSFFTSQVYRSLYALSLDPNIELGPRSMHLLDPRASPGLASSSNKVNISTPTLLLTRVLTSILLTPSSPPQSLLAASMFKRLLSASLQTPEKSAIALLSLLVRVAEKHGRKIEPLWYSEERKGDGSFHGESETVDGFNVFAVGSGVWEAELLKKHYCFRVREEMKEVDTIIAGLNR